MTTHTERIHEILKGARPDRVPVALWRHFPVDDQLPETLAAATLQFQATYDFNIVKVTPASSFAVKGWGVEDKWMGDAEGTRRYIKHVINTPQDWEQLPLLSPATSHLAGQLECLRLIRKGLGLHTPMIQTVFSPLAQAKNLAGNETLLAHLRQYPAAVAKGLETIAKTTRNFIDAAIDTGIDGIFYAIQHAQASLLTFDEYKSFGLPNDQIVFEPAHGLWCNLLHLHGTGVYFSIVNSLRFQIVNWHDRETHPSLAEAQGSITDVVCGGLRQDTLVFEDQAKVIAETEDALRQTSGERFILGTGCVVPIIAPHGNLMAARKSVE